MKTIKQSIIGLALSVFSITAIAQCPTVTNMSVTLGANGTATVTPILSGSVSPSQTMFYWYVTPNANQTSGMFQSSGTFQFPANGTYTLSVSINDSLNGCWLTGNTSLTISNLPPTSCSAGFTAYTDSNCVTYFTNTSTGNNLTYQWYDMSNGFTLLSNNINPTANLSNGNYLIGLYTYSNGMFCDSVTQVINVGCSGSNTVTCQASFYTYTDSLCMTHFINTSVAPGGNNSSQWYINGNNYSTPDVALNLADGSYGAYLFNYSNGTFCDSTYQLVNVACGNGTNTPCQASFYSYTDSSCVTHFINTSSGNNLTSSWTINNICYPPSGSILSISLANGFYPILLQTYSNGILCDSTYQNITVNCANGGTVAPTGCQVNSSFYIFADSTNTGNYFAYNLSTGTGTVSYLWDFGDGTTSTQQYPFHQYAIPGQYVVCLTTNATYSNMFGGVTTCSDTYCDSSSVQRMASGFLMSQVNVIPQSAAGIKQTEILTQLNAYPNPMANELIIEVSTKNNNSLNYVLIDALGRVVLTGIIENSKATLNTSSLEKGFYSLSITNEKGSSLKAIKIVK